MKKECGSFCSKGEQEHSIFCFILLHIYGLPLKGINKKRPFCLSVKKLYLTHTTKKSKTNTLTTSLYIISYYYRVSK